MSVVERFRQAWEAKFPSEPPPDLPCLHVGHDQVRAKNDAYSSVYDTVYSRLNPAAVEQALQFCNATIAQLHLQLERQQFVAEYLWEVLHYINTASVAELQPAPLVLRHGTRSSMRAQDRAAEAPFDETDQHKTGSPNSGLDNIVPILESPSSCSVSPPSINTVGGKVFPGDKTAGLTSAGSGFDAMSVCNNKRQQKIRRENSLPLLDQEQKNPEFEAESERTSSLDSVLQNVVSVADASANNVVKPVDVFKHKRLTPSTSLSSPTAYRQKPVPTPRVTVNKQAASSTVVLDDVVVGESSTDESASAGGNMSSLQLQQDPKRTGGISSFRSLSPKRLTESSAGSESVSSVSGDHNVRSVKQRALAFTVSNPLSSSVPISMQKMTVGDSLPSADSASPRHARQRRAERVHVYEEVVPVKDETDSDEVGAVSSDDEEPLYYNLKMLQQTMLNRAKTFYSKGAQRPMTEHSKELETGSASKTRLNPLTEDDMHQLSGDSSKYLNIFIAHQLI